ncbi:exonuclease subunit SbcD [Cetobacterium sp. 8H]|uniref:metallophosphoesterase family protein n=1 Tax=Cetobacterium sp. 8H TaxID=2759681 RepID=UPI00163BF0AE|nr:exonuclease subunit SbcD [Cetobacterium sp. 8H]MBC2850060.1 exonuclease subunit SbcD [Cetobacterium sp. 8H]
MKILHTSDWHLGKKLEGQSRLNEQKKFIDALETIVDTENIDLILLAGDIYDTYNPSAEAEKLFFDSIKILSKNGEVGIVIIPGNHDNPQRLASVCSLAKDYGVIIYERAFQEIPIGKYGCFNIYNSNQGGIFIEKNGEKIYIYTLPFPSETTLNETFNDIKFNIRIKEILEEGVNQNKDGIPTILMTHIYVAGSMGEGDVALELGGARAIGVDDLPKANYIALGHVHKPMSFKNKNAYYCGSPIEYRVTENKFDKKVFAIDISKDKTTVKDILLENYKPIREYTVMGSEEAIKKSEELSNANEWIYLYVKLDTPLTNSEIRKIKNNKNILEIIPIIETKENIIEVSNYNEQNLEEAFIEFFKEESDGLEPNSNLKKLFLSLIEEGEKIETN